MSPEQFEIAQGTASSFPLLTSAFLRDKTPRTLLYGHFFEGAKLHVYLDASGEIHRRCYRLPAAAGQALLVLDHSSGPAGGTHTNKMLAPTGPGSVAYPEHSDFEFVILLKHAGVTLNFSPCPDTPVQPSGISPYAGLTPTDGGVELDHLRQRLGTTVGFDFSQRNENLDVRILSVACRNVGAASYNIKLDGTFLVERTRADDVLVECRRLADTLPAVWVESSTALHNVFWAAFGTKGDCARVTVSYVDGAARGTTYSTDGCYPESSVTKVPRYPEMGTVAYPMAYCGVWDEQPFAVVVRESTRLGRKGAVETGMFEIVLHLSQFGDKAEDQARFLRENGFVA